jgi:hypothetical protein
MGDALEQPAILVEVDLYSGRPNPRFRIPRSLAGELVNRLADLPSTEVPKPSVPLGYRGLRVESGQLGAVGEIRLFDGVATVRLVDGSLRQLSDPNRDTERWLIGLGAGLVDREVAIYLQSELDR